MNGKTLSNSECASLKSIFLLDASLALARIQVDMQYYNPDFMGVDSAMYVGPVGVGFLRMRNRIRKKFKRISSEIDCPPSDEDLGRSVGMSYALERRQERLRHECTHLTEHVGEFKARIMRRRSLGTVAFVGSMVPTLPGFILALFPNVPGERICEQLLGKGITASPVNLVYANGHRIPLIRNMVYSSEHAKGAVSFCFGPENALDDIARIAATIP